MLDRKLILENPEAIAEKLLKKGCKVDFAPLLKLEAKRKELLVSVETAKAERNRLSATVPQVKKEGGDVNAIFAKVKEISAKSAADEAELDRIKEDIKNFLMPLPNLPDDDLVAGGKENNKVIHEYGKPIKFDFEAKNHVDLCESLGKTVVCLCHEQGKV